MSTRSSLAIRKLGIPLGASYGTPQFVHNHSAVSEPAHAGQIRWSRKWFTDGFASKETRDRPRSGRVKIAQRFSAGTSGPVPSKSAKRTAELTLSLLVFEDQPSVSRTLI